MTYIYLNFIYQDKSQFVFKSSNNNFNLEIYIIVNYNYTITIFSFLSWINNYYNNNKSTSFIDFNSFGL